MFVVHHPDQALHDPDRVFRTGQFIEQPDRAERYRIFLDIVQRDGHEIIQAPLGSLDPILEMHDTDYVEFLRTVYARWSENSEYGPEVIPNVHPTHRMHRKPTELLGQLGWYSNSTSCPITGDVARRFCQRASCHPRRGPPEKFRRNRLRLMPSAWPSFLS